MYRKWPSDRVTSVSNGWGNQPTVQVWSAKKVQVGFWPVSWPDPLLHGGPNTNPYPSTRRFCCVCQDPSVPISRSGWTVFLLMVTFRYPTANRKILTLVSHHDSLMYWTSVWSIRVETRWLPHPENERQQSVYDFLSCILGNLSGDWLHIFIIEVLATWIGRWESDTIPAPSWTWAAMERQQFLALLKG